MIRNHDAPRAAWLFGRPYWWERTTDGPPILQPANWIKEK